MADIRVGGAYVTLSANAAPYVRGMGQGVAANRQFAASVTGLSTVAGRFSSSITSSLVATAAYAVGVGLIARLTAGAGRDFLAFEGGLVAVQKTAGLTGSELVELGGNLDRITTTTSILGKALPVAREELLGIADVAGQMNIRGVRDLTAFTEAVGILTLTTDLGGRDAANSLGILLTNTRTLASETYPLVSALTALGNSFRGGERDILAVANVIARSTAAFQLAAGDILSLSAVLAAAGTQPEQAGTVVQRGLSALVNSAAEAAGGDFARVAAIIASARDETVGFDQDMQNFLSTIQEGTQESRFAGLLRLIEAVRNVGPSGQLGLLTTIFGGETPQVRIQRTLGVLAVNYEEIGRAINITNAELENQVAAAREAGNFIASYGGRLQVVTNQILEQSTAIGSVLIPGLTALGENFKLVEAAIIGGGAGLLVSRGFSGFAAQGRALTKESRNAAMAAREHGGSVQLLNRRVRESRNLRRGYLRDLGTERRLRRSLARSTTAQAAASRRAATESANAQTQRRQLGTAFGVSGGGRFEARAQERLAEANRRVVGTEKQLAAVQGRRAASYISVDGARRKNIQSQVQYDKLGRQERRLVSDLAVAKREEAKATALATRNNRAGARALAGVRTAALGTLRILGPLALGFAAFEGIAFIIRALRRDTEGLAETARRAKEIIEADRQAGISAPERAIEQLQDEIEILEAAARALSEGRARSEQLDRARRSNLVSAGVFDVDRVLGPGALTAQAEEIARFDRDIAENLAAQATRREGLTTALTTQVQAIEAIRTGVIDINSALVTAGDAAREFRRNTVAGLEDGITRARFLGAGLSRATREAEELRRDTELAFQAEVARGEAAAVSAERVLTGRRRQLQQAREFLSANLETLAVDKEAREEVEQRVEAIEREVDLAEDRLGAARATLAVLREELVIDDEILEIIQRQADARQESRIAQLDDFRLPAQLTDLTGAEDRGVALLRSLEDQTLERQRSADLAREQLGLTEREAAVLEAQASVRAEIFNVERTLLNEIADAEREIAQQQERRAQLVEAIGTATGDDAETYRELRNEVDGVIDAEERRLEVLLAELLALDGQTERFEEIVGIIGRLADIQFGAENPAFEGLARLAEDSRDLDAAIDRGLVSTFLNLEEALVDSFESGRIAVDELATAIGRDLVRELIRATITGRLAQSALSFLGVGGGGGATVAAGHTGGIGGHLRQRRNIKTGLRADETFAVLLRDEEVLKRDDPRHRWNIRGQSAESLRAWVGRLPRFHEGGIAGGGRGPGASSTMPVSVRVTNPPGLPTEVQASSAYVDGDRLFVDVMLRDARKRGPITQMIKQLSGTAR